MRIRWFGGLLLGVVACGGQILGTGASQLQVQEPDDAGPEATDAASPEVTAAPVPTFTPTVRFVDISAGRGPGSGWYPSTQLDVAGGKLLVATENDAQAATPSLFRCNLDGSSCVHTDLSAGRPPGCGYNPSLVLDDANGKLIVATDDGAFDADRYHTSIFRCELDGTACAVSSASNGGDHMQTPQAVLDEVSGRMLVVAQDNDKGGLAYVARCARDGTGCSYGQLGASQGWGWMPSVVVDRTSGKLFVAAETSDSRRPYLFRCDLSATACTSSEIVVGPALSGITPSAVLDATNGKLLVVTDNGWNGLGPALLRCNVDGTGCAYIDISAGQPGGSGVTPSAVIDAASGKLLVATYDRARDGRLGLFRCDLDGTACAYADISADQGPASGQSPSAVLDAAHHKLLVVTAAGTVPKPALFIVDL